MSFGRINSARRNLRFIVQKISRYRSIRLRDVDLPTRAEQVYLALEEQSLNFESDPALVWIKLNSVIATMIG
jgi:hypothetical protein